MFYDFDNSKNFDLSSFDTKNEPNIETILYVLINLTNFDLSSFDTKNLTNIGNIFKDCNNNLTNIDLYVLIKKM